MARQTQLCYVLAIAFLSCFLVMRSFADEGKATFYTPPYLPSACNGFTEEGVMIAAASDAFWNDGEACGQKYSVQCIGPNKEGNNDPCTGSDPVVVTIVDYCPPGCHGTIDLSAEVFALIADPDAGVIRVAYNRATASHLAGDGEPCGTASNFILTLIHFILFFVILQYS